MPRNGSIRDGSCCIAYEEWWKERECPPSTVWLGQWGGALVAPAAFPTAVALTVAASMVIPAVAVPLPVTIAALVTALAIAVLSPVLRAGPAAVAPLAILIIAAALLFTIAPLCAFLGLSSVRYCNWLILRLQLFVKQLISTNLQIYM